MATLMQDEYSGEFASLAARAATLDLDASPWPHFDQAQRQVVDDVLRSGKVNYWTGDQNAHFEKEFARAFGTRHAIAVANGSLGLDLALIALGIGPGDEVIVTPRSYFASVSSVLLTGATPVFADVEHDSQNLSVRTIEPLLTDKTRAIMPVHLAGWPCDMASIMDLARSRDLAVIEDCAQAHGATIDGHSVGSFGDISAFSFCQDKIMTTGGEGGMVVTSSDDLWQRAWSYKDHGKSYATVHRKDHPLGFRWLHESVGNNFRLTEMQAAIGRVQIQRLGDWVHKRRALADAYVDRFAELPALRTAQPPANVVHAYYKFYTFVRPDALRENWSRDRIMQEIMSLGVPCYSGSCPEIYREKAITSRGLAPQKSLPVARELGETSLMFLVHPTLSLEQVQTMADIAAAVVQQATR